MLKNKV